MGWRQLIIEHHDVDVHTTNRLCNLNRLTRTDKSLGRRRVHLLRYTSDDLTVGRIDQAFELIERVIHIPARTTGIKPNNERSLRNGSR